MGLETKACRIPGRRWPSCRVLAVAACLSIALGALLAAPLVAQQPGPEAGFGETIDIRLVNLEVVVTGRDREPLSGLGLEDFRLLVDGEEVKIDFFTEIREGRAVTEETGTGTVRVQAPPAVGDEDARVGTHYLIFVDDSTLIGAKRARLLEHLEGQLGSLRPQDRIAVLRFDGRAVELVQDWSTDRTAWRRSLERVLERPPRGVEIHAELRRLQSSGRLSRNSEARQSMYRSHGSVAADGSFPAYQQYLGDPSHLDPEELDYALRVLDRVEAAVGASAAALRSLPAPPGRKVLVLLAGDLPFSIGQYVAGLTSQSAERVVTDSRLPTGEELYAPLVDTANLLGYTLYPVDAGGVTTYAADVEQTASLAPSELAALSDAENEVHFALAHVAEETGGRAILNNANVEALERVVVDTASYYWLGFYAPRHGDDERHEIVVEVDRPGVRVRSRKGFVDLSAAVERDLAVESALYLGPEGVGEPLGVEVGEPRRKRGDRDRMMVPLTLELPAAAIELRAQGADGPWVAELDLRLAAVDEDGGRAEPLRVPVTLTLPREPGPETIIRYQVEVELRRVEQRVAVLLHDPSTLRTLAGRVEVSPR